MIIYAKNKKINSKASEASLAPQASHQPPKAASVRVYPKNASYLNLNFAPKIRYLQFISRATECLTGVDTLLFFAKQVSNAPLSSRCKSLKMTVEVTVEPDDTSEVSRIG